MAQDVPEDLLHLGIHPVAVPLLLGRAGPQHIPVHVDQQLLAQGVRHAGGAEAPVPLGRLHLLDALHIVEPPLRVEPQQVEPPLPGGVEAGRQRLAGVAAPLQPLPAQPHHHPLIGLRRVDDGPVDQVVAHQQHVPGPEEVGDALHHVGDLSPQQQDQFVKGVVVVVHRLGPAVLQVEQAEVLLQISPLADLVPVQHLPPPLPYNGPRRPPAAGALLAIVPHLAGFHNREAEKSLRFGSPRPTAGLSFPAGFAILCCTRKKSNPEEGPP